MALICALLTALEVRHWYNLPTVLWFVVSIAFWFVIPVTSSFRQVLSLIDVVAPSAVKIDFVQSNHVRVDLFQQIRDGVKPILPHLFGLSIPVDEG